MAKANKADDTDRQRDTETDFDYAARRAETLSRNAADSTYRTETVETLDGGTMTITVQELGPK